MTDRVLSADFYKGYKGSPMVEISVIEAGHRTCLRSRPCANKREARKIAAEYGATPWNF